MYIFTGSYSSVTCTACQVSGGIIHFFWLTFFAWTGETTLELFVVSVTKRYQSLNIISSDPPFRDGNERFTIVSLNPLSD